MPLTFNIADIRDPSKRNASYSKTLSIPGTKTNNQLFSFIFEINKEVYTTDEAVNFSPDFNPNLKAVCLVYIDSILQMKGYIQLVNVLRTENSISYECVLYSEVNNIFADIGEAKLTDLDLSKYDHPYTSAVIKNSWDTSVYVNGSPSSFAYGSGYVYGMIDLGYTNGLTYATQHWFPSIYLKTYIDAIFEEAGYTYTSSAITSDLFKRFIIPFNRTKLELSKEQIDRYLFKSVCDTFTFTSSGGSVQNPDFDDEQWDLGDNYNTSTLRYTAHAAGIHIFDFTGDYVLDSASVAFIRFLVYKNGSLLSEHNFNPALSGSFNVGVYGVELQAGDYVEFKMGVNTTGSVSGDLYTITNFGVANRLTSTVIQEGNTLPMSICVPYDVFQKDLLLSVIKMFNLYVEVDKNNDKNLIMEYRPNYYDNNEIVDWTKKLDYSQRIEIKPLSELSARQYRYTYKPDKDYYNELYTKETNLIYGEYSTVISNDFQKGTNLLEVIFSPTPLVGSDLHDRVVPKFISIDANGVIKERETNIRLLAYNGLKSCEPWDFTSASEATSTHNNYPYIGHLDDPYNPLIGDLNFGIPLKVYFNSGTYINKNIFTYLHAQFLEEITSKDSKMFTGYFRLTPLDIYILNFRNFVFVKDAYYIINKIIDYDYLNNETTKVELLKIKNASPYEFSYLPAPPIAVNQNVNVIEGGEDEVRDIAATSEWTIIEGGENEVRDIGATSNIYIING